MDFGCGDGSFLKSLINSNIEATYYGTNVSDTMIYMAKSGINNKNVNLVISDGFNMSFSDNLRFHLIHLDSVVHHLIGKSISDSKNLADKILRILMSMLKDDGSLILEDLYYDSYVFPSLTSKLIFYGLKSSNSLNIDISKIIKEYHKRLGVRFLHEDEIVKILRVWRSKFSKANSLANTNFIWAFSSKKARTCYLHNNKR